MTSTPGCLLLAGTKPALPTKLSCNTFLMKPTADRLLYASWFTTSVMPTNPVTQSPESTAPTHRVIKVAIVRRYPLFKAPQTCTQSGTLWSTNNPAPKQCLFLHPTGIHTVPQRQAYTQLIPWLPKSSTIQIPLTGLQKYPPTFELNFINEALGQVKFRKSSSEDSTNRNVSQHQAR